MTITTSPEYRWPEGALRVITEMETKLGDLLVNIGDLAVLSRMHYASGTAALCLDAKHDVAHAIAHIESAHRALTRVYDRGQALGPGD